MTCRFPSVQIALFWLLLEITQNIQSLIDCFYVPSACSRYRTRHSAVPDPSTKSGDAYAAISGRPFATNQPRANHWHFGLLAHLLDDLLRVWSINPTRATA